MNSDQFDKKMIANATDYSPVSLFFNDDTITHIFSQLLEVHGFKTSILGDIGEYDGSTRIITEPQFFSRIDPAHHRKCLVIGNKESLNGINALSLSRPLTEEKIEHALSRFLGL